MQQQEIATEGFQAQQQIIGFTRHDLRACSMGLSAWWSTKRNDTFMSFIYIVNANSIVKGQAFGIQTSTAEPLQVLTVILQDSTNC